MSLPRLFRTARYLKPSQVYYRLRHRLFPPRIDFGDVSSDLRVRDLDARDFIPSRRGIFDGSGEFRFLNVSRVIDPDNLDWRADEYSKLWRYNLHYFDYLHNGQCSAGTRARLIDSWIDGNPIGTTDAWEPYTVSLRIVNWIKALMRDEPADIRQRWLESLYTQSRWLSKNIEFDLLANHYLKNGKALFFAGAYFEGDEADRWFADGLAILLNEAREQLLPDGGHFERSPMYHCIVVEDFLDVINIAMANRDLIGSQESETLAESVTRALDFLDDIIHPDGDIPLFNDAAFGIAPSPASLINYGQSLVDFAPQRDRHQRAVIDRRSTGLIGCRQGDNYFLLDCGPVGPDYQPGHAHADTLSFELSISGRRVIVDSGVSDYEDSELRSYVRSTAAHNTAVVDRQNQSEVWSAFRVGRRARPISVQIHAEDDGLIALEAAHDGYQTLAGSVTHARRVETDGHTYWQVQDEIAGNGSHRVESLIHLHPDLAVEQLGNTFRINDQNGLEAAQISVLSQCDITLRSGFYCPEFGINVANPVIALQQDCALPISIRYRIDNKNA